MCKSVTTGQVLHAQSRKNRLKPGEGMVGRRGSARFSTKIPVKQSELAVAKTVRREVHTIGGHQFAPPYALACGKWNDC